MCVAYKDILVRNIHPNISLWSPYSVRTVIPAVILLWRCWAAHLCPILQQLLPSVKQAPGTREGLLHLPEYTSTAKTTLPAQTVLANWLHPWDTWLFFKPKHPQLTPRFNQNKHRSYISHPSLNFAAARKLPDNRVPTQPSCVQWKPGETNTNSTDLFVLFTPENKPQHTDHHVS